MPSLLQVGIFVLKLEVDIHTNIHTISTFSIRRSYNMVLTIFKLSQLYRCIQSHILVPDFHYDLFFG
jgi:hypothetical protein